MNYRRVFIENSCVFLTIVTNNRRNILINNIELIKKSFRNAENYFKFDLIAYVILPDHFHLIIKPENINEYPKIITSIKYYSSKHFDVIGLESPTYDRNKGIWQRRYFEHTIVSEEDLHNHLNYVHYNPVKHEEVKCVKDWQHSTFQKFVKLGNYDIDWGSMQDAEKIKELNYE